MALSNLISDRIEKYGGIDLKNNYQKYFSSSLGAAVGIHLLVLFCYLAWTWFSVEDTKKIPHLRIRNLTELAAPPSTSQEQEAAPLQQAAPQTNVALPSFGIPVAVPDAVAPQAVMPDLNNLPTQGAVSDGPVGGAVGGLGDVPAHIEVKETKEAEPSKDDFIDVEEEPKPIVNIQSLVEYPEVAKRAGLEGKVTAEVLIGKDGKVEKIDILKSDFKVFDDAARAALMKARFTPARQNGQPVRIWFTVPITFKLQSK